MRKFFTFFLALAASIGMSWAKTTSVKFEAHGNEKTVEVEVPYTFWCDYDNENGELDLIIQELYALQYGGYCDSDDTPVASGNDAVTAGKGGYKDKDQFITISAPFEGKVTVTGKYWDYVDGWSEYIFDYNLTISIVSSGEDPEPEGDGKLTGAFTINESGDQIVFSKGNLQYRASTNTWQFAANQYDIIGSDNSNISDSYSGWIDMFGWGTGNNPTNSSTKDDDYSTLVDWGANAISNGGNEANQWRTLTKDEWGYLFNTRTDAASLFGLGSVNGVNGTIILPDNWVTPDGASFTPSTSKGLAYEVTSEGFRYYDQYDGHFDDNTYTAEQWSVMEQNGAVFLPAAGSRWGSDVRDVGSCGLYWSATFEGCVFSCTAYNFRFVSDLLNPQNLSKPGCGIPVRLVATSVIPTPTPDPGEATAIDEIVNRQSSNRKLIIDGQILILRGDKTYTLTGQRVE